MTADELRAAATLPDGLSAALQALWHEARGDWRRAHDVLQADQSREGAWVHAYLHRVEGDQANAAYWYRRAGRPASMLALADEWQSIAADLLARR
jgi:hypothetical protein